MALTGAAAARTARCSGDTSLEWCGQVTHQINKQTRTTGPEGRGSVSRVAGYNYYLRCSVFIRNYEQLCKETRKYNPNRKTAGSRAFL